jgi:hypothetical protein
MQIETQIKEIQLLQVSLHVKEGNNLPINQAPSSKIKKQCLDTTKQYF